MREEHLNEVSTRFDALPDYVKVLLAIVAGIILLRALSGLVGLAIRLIIVALAVAVLIAVLDPSWWAELQNNARDWADARP